MAGLVLVDSSVWVEVLAKEGSPYADEIAGMFQGSALVATTGLIVQEVLQGVRMPRELARVSTFLGGLRYLPVLRETHVRAAALHRKLRGIGVTGSTVDLVIAQLAIDHAARLWSLDRHFEDISRAGKLKLWRPPR